MVDTAVLETLGICMVELEPIVVMELGEKLEDAEEDVSKLEDVEIEEIEEIEDINEERELKTLLEVCKDDDNDDDPMLQVPNPDWQPLPQYACVLPLLFVSSG